MLKAMARNPSVCFGTLLFLFLLGEQVADDIVGACRVVA